MHPSRRPLIAGNWKMNTTLADAHILADGVRQELEHEEKVDVVLCPPSIWLGFLAERLGPGKVAHVSLGAQNCHPEMKGAYTGELSTEMIKEVADYVIIGHSERVQYFHEKPDFLLHKIEAAFRAGLTPILCIGEVEQVAGSTKKLVQELNHIVRSLTHAQLEQLVVAYEPVWAIGTGNVATPEYAQEVISLLRTVLTEKTRILYGGSSNDENARGLLAMPDIDGFLVGGASLKLKSFVTMVKIADQLA